MTFLQAVSTLLPPGTVAVVEDSSTFRDASDRETFAQRFRRVSDELLWPRILVRNAPPQG